MIKSKFCDLLRALSTKECTAFKEFLHSPYFNKNPRLKKLFDIVQPFAPKFNSEQLRKETIFPLVFDGPFNEYKINNDISDLLQLLYHFLAIQELKRKPTLKLQLLSTDLLNREKSYHIKRSALNFEKALDKMSLRNQDYFYEAYQLSKLKDAYFLHRSERFYDPNLQEKSNQIDAFYFVVKFRIACDMLGRSTAVKANYDCAHLDELIAAYLQNKQYQEIPSIRIYFLGYSMLKNESDDYYHDFKNNLFEHQHIFPKAELWVLYNYALNHCIRKINSGDSNFYPEIQEMYQVLLDNEIILKNGYITQWDYKNIVTVGLRVRDYDWTRNFILDYKKLLPEQEQKNASAYNLAALYYETSDYTNALQQLHNVEFTDASYHLGAKIIQLKSYYELNETEPLYALIEAFRKYILRSKDLSDYRKKANANFLKLARRTYQLKINKGIISDSDWRKKQLSIREKLKELDPVANKDWLEGGLR